MLKIIFSVFARNSKIFCPRITSKFFKFLKIFGFFLRNFENFGIKKLIIIKNINFIQKTYVQVNIDQYLFLFGSSTVEPSPEVEAQNRKFYGIHRKLKHQSFQHCQNLYIHMLVLISQAYTLVKVRRYKVPISLQHLQGISRASLGYLSIRVFKFFQSLSGNWLSAPNFKKCFGHFSCKTFSLVMNPASLGTLCTFTITTLNRCGRLKYRR